MGCWANGMTTYHTDSDLFEAATFMLLPCSLNKPDICFRDLRKIRLYCKHSFAKGVWASSQEVSKPETSYNPNNPNIHVSGRVWGPCWTYQGTQFHPSVLPGLFLLLYSADKKYIHLMPSPSDQYSRLSHLLQVHSPHEY